MIRKEDRRNFKRRVNLYTAKWKRKEFFTRVNTAVFICKSELRTLIPDLLVTSENRELSGLLIHKSAAKWFISKNLRSNVTN